MTVKVAFVPSVVASSVTFVGSSSSVIFVETTVASATKLSNFLPSVLVSVALFIWFSIFAFGSKYTSSRLTPLVAVPLAESAAMLIVSPLSKVTVTPSWSVIAFPSASVSVAV